MITIDFETRSKCPLRTAGAWRYAADPTTEVLCLGYQICRSLPLETKPEVWVPGDDTPDDLLRYIKDGMTVDAHHAFFEKAIWRNIMVKRHGWPDIPDNQWSCTASRAAALALPRSLDEVGRVLNLKNKKDATWGKQTMLKLARPRTPTASNPSDWHEDKQDFKDLYKYCLGDVAAEVELGKVLRPLNPTERKVWLLDQKINERGIRVDRRAVECALDLLTKYSETLYKEFRTLTGGMVHTVLQRDKLILWLSTQGVPTEKLAKADVQDLLEAKDKELPAKARRVLEIRQALSRTSTAKYTTILGALNEDDRLRDLLMYHGASTGRWTGKLVQPQNFPRQTLRRGLDTCFDILKTGSLDAFEFCYPDVMGTLSGVIRGVFIPAEGHTFYGGDFASIEARVLFWLAGEEKGLDMFRRGDDLYKDLASVIYRKPVAEVTKAERELGKRGILGAGYGMGKVKFRESCWLYARIPITEELAETAINAYREKYNTVCRLWANQNSAAMQAVAKPGSPVKSGRVTWMVKDGYLFCALPSGRLLAYFDPKIEPHETAWKETKDTVTYMSVNSVSKKWERTKTYGGKIVENLCQAVARDLMAEAMLRIEDAGYKVVLTVHDEILTEKVGGDVKEFENLMAELPAWATGLPVKAEGWQGKRYQK